jgi:hypothetical protein
LVSTGWWNTETEDSPMSLEAEDSTSVSRKLVTYGKLSKARD